MCEGLSGHSDQNQPCVKTPQGAAHICLFRQLLPSAENQTIKTINVVISCLSIDVDSVNDCNALQKLCRKCSFSCPAVNLKMCPYPSKIPITAASLSQQLVHYSMEHLLIYLYMTLLSVSLLFSFKGHFFSCSELCSIVEMACDGISWTALIKLKEKHHDGLSSLWQQGWDAATEH